MNAREGICAGAALAFAMVAAAPPAELRAPQNSVPSNLASLELAQDPIGWQSRAESRHL
jgi:hypothetical protein